MVWILCLTVNILLVVTNGAQELTEDFQEYEEIECETVPETNLLRNGLGDDSFFLWSDKIIPFVIGEGFNETNKANILEAIDDYNAIFEGCLQWKPRSDEVNEPNMLISCF